jgi:hypothetical protein
MFKWIHNKRRNFMEKGAYPDDPMERMRIKAFILGAGAGAAMQPGPDGKIRIGVEQKDERGMVD